MYLYKLTTQDNKTRKGYENETTWGENVTHSVQVKGDLCSEGIIHAYEHPIFAVIYNGEHASISNPKLWLAKGVVAKRDSHKKCGTYSLTTVKEIKKPTDNQLRKFAVLVALELYDLWKDYDKDQVWKKWAKECLNTNVFKYSTAAANAAAVAVAANAAANAARAAVRAAANAVYYITYDATNATYAVAYAVADVVTYHNNIKIDFLKLARKAMK